MHLVFQFQNLQLLIFDLDGQEFQAILDYVILYLFCNIKCFNTLIRSDFFRCIKDLCSFHVHTFLSNQLIVFFDHHLNLKQFIQFKTLRISILHLCCAFNITFSYFVISLRPSASISFFSNYFTIFSIWDAFK